MDSLAAKLTIVNLDLLSQFDSCYARCSLFKADAIEEEKKVVMIEYDSAWNTTLMDEVAEILKLCARWPAPHRLSASSILAAELLTSPTIKGLDSWFRSTRTSFG